MKNLEKLNNLINEFSLSKTEAAARVKRNKSVLNILKDIYKDNDYAIYKSTSTHSSIQFRNSVSDEKQLEIAQALEELGVVVFTSDKIAEIEYYK